MIYDVNNFKMGVPSLNSRRQKFGIVNVLEKIATHRFYCVKIKIGWIIYRKWQFRTAMGPYGYIAGVCRGQQRQFCKGTCVGIKLLGTDRAR